MIPEIETQIGANLARIVADRGYRGHNAPPDHKFKLYISGQRRRVTETVKRELRRRSAVEPVIGHAKAEHRMGRNYLAGTHGDAANAVLRRRRLQLQTPARMRWLSCCPQSWPPSTPPPLTTARSNPPDRVLHSRQFMRTGARVSPSWPGGDIRGRIRCGRLISRRRSRQNPLQTGRTHCEPRDEWSARLTARGRGLGPAEIGTATGVSHGDMIKTVME